MNHNKNWEWVDTRSKSNQIYHKIQMTAHLKALASAKPRIKLNEPNPMFERNMEAREEEEELEERDPMIHKKRFEKK